MMTSLHDVTAGGWRRRAMTYSTGRRRGGANGRLRAADVAAMQVGINVQRCAVAPAMWRRVNERRRRAMSPMTSPSGAADVAATRAGGNV